MASGLADGWEPARLGSAIRAVRTSRGLSVSELARRSELSQSFLSQVEIGNTDISVGRLVRVAEALDVALADLVDHRFKTNERATPWGGDSDHPSMIVPQTTR